MQMLIHGVKHPAYFLFMRSIGRGQDRFSTSLPAGNARRFARLSVTVP
jgi:hypothetical protein